MRYYGPATPCKNCRHEAGTHIGNGKCLRIDMRTTTGDCKCSGFVPAYTEADPSVWLAREWPDALRDAIPDGQPIVDMENCDFDD